MAFKRPLPEWNNPGVEPPQSKKDVGWLGREKPPAQWHNWFQHLVFKALEELQQGAAHVTFGETEPASPDENDLWVDTSEYPALVLKAWDGTQWITVGAVSSVNGKTGDVELTAEDVGAASLNDFASHAHRHAADGEDPIMPEMIGSVPIGRTINGKALTGNIVLNHNDVGAINSVATSSTSDPNTTTEPYILTNHANSPGRGIYWHILTFFYSQRTLSANRAQLAVSYNGSTVMVFARHNYGGTWTPWRELYNDGSHPKITVSSAAPSNPKYGDLWIEP